MTWRHTCLKYPCSKKSLKEEKAGLEKDVAELEAEAAALEAQLATDAEVNAEQLASIKELTVLQSMR